MRRLRILLRPAAAAGLLAGVAVAAAPQDKDDLFPEAYLVADGGATDYKSREVDLGLRPNTELPFAVYVRNPHTDPRPSVKVVLAADKDGLKPLAEGVVPNLAANSSARVKLTAVGAPTPPPAAKAGEAPAATRLTAPALFLRTTLADGDRVRVSDPIKVLVKKPSEYLVSPQPTFVAAQDGSGYVLTITLTDIKAKVGDVERPFRGPPAKAVLDIRPALVNVDPAAPKAGTYEASVPPGGSAVLSAAKLKFADGKPPAGKFAVSVDGYNRAFTYDITAEGNNVTLRKDGFALLDLPRFAVPGKPLAVRVEAFQESTGGKPELTFQRAVTGSPEVLLANAPSLRDEVRTLKIGADGELVVGLALKDWVVPVDTAGVYGPRTFTLLAPPPTKAEAVVTFDATPPALALVDIAKSKLVGSELTVYADAADDESGLKDVTFYLGEPPGADGKLPPTSEKADGLAFVPAKGQKAVAGRYTAKFLLPDVKGKVKVYARATNGAELATLTEGATVQIVDPPSPEKEKAKRQVGDIKVKVIQGSTPERPQPGLPVELKTAAGATIDSATTDDKGEATFKDVPPGSYVVTSVKKADYGAKALASVSVKADKKSEVTLEIKR